MSQMLVQLKAYLEHCQLQVDRHSYSAVLSNSTCSLWNWVNKVQTLISIKVCLDCLISTFYVHNLYFQIKLFAGRLGRPCQLGLGKSRSKILLHMQPGTRRYNHGSCNPCIKGLPLAMIRNFYSIHSIQDIVIYK